MQCCRLLCISKGCGVQFCTIDTIPIWMVNANRYNSHHTIDDMQLFSLVYAVCSSGCTTTMLSSTTKRLERWFEVKCGIGNRFPPLQTPSLVLFFLAFQSTTPFDIDVCDMFIHPCVRCLSTFSFHTSNEFVTETVFMFVECVDVSFTFSATTDVTLFQWTRCRMRCDSCSSLNDCHSFNQKLSSISHECASVATYRNFGRTKTIFVSYGYIAIAIAVIDSNNILLLHIVLHTFHCMANDDRRTYCQIFVFHFARRSSLIEWNTHDNTTMALYTQRMSLQVSTNSFVICCSCRSSVCVW